ncbi:hypothetical protein HYH03_013130 [Edaphochlamys debaryana]|uniref:Uncharacterized protein n=1 Tax=Edaphochlamys debaryana TaxID=47281 RepID=A0A835XRE2_9CHLO|nr:hypothetical protein HYH03_013130 [Edaphochlamys debaryana]|eukprot:KAG2488280.1 hypothetical protein HYH03_013130 [Edaphochlamys debaryana]
MAPALRVRTRAPGAPSTARPAARSSTGTPAPHAQPHHHHHHHHHRGPGGRVAHAARAARLRWALTGAVALGLVLLATEARARSLEGSSRGLKTYTHYCASPPCLPDTTTAGQDVNGPRFDMPAGTGSGPAYNAGAGSGPTAVLGEAVLPRPVQPAPQPFAPTVVGTGGINVISSNPISISNPITIKNPNVNFDKNAVGALGGGGIHGGGGYGLKGGLLQGAGQILGGVGAVAGALLGRRAG